MEHTDNDLIATIDDDNIPFDDWGLNVFVGDSCRAAIVTPVGDNRCFDPMSMTNHSDLWHRGFPLEMVATKNRIQVTNEVIDKVLIQVNLWNGDPDVDAIVRLAKRPMISLETEPKNTQYVPSVITPFNSQNTILHRSIVPYYMCLPGVGRFDDIWGAYLLQAILFREGKSKFVMFDKANVYQNRNEQNLVSNLEAEIYGYRNTFQFVNMCNDLKYTFEHLIDFLPKTTKESFLAYNARAMQI
jgi:hypothetical protein